MFRLCAFFMSLFLLTDCAPNMFWAGALARLFLLSGAKAPLRCFRIQPRTSGMVATGRRSGCAGERFLLLLLFFLFFYTSLFYVGCSASARVRSSGCPGGVVCNLEASTSVKVPGSNLALKGNFWEGYDARLH